MGLLDSASRSTDAPGHTKDVMRIGAVVNVEGTRARDGSNHSSTRALDVRRRHSRSGAAAIDVDAITTKLVIDRDGILQ